MRNLGSSSRSSVVVVILLTSIHFLCTCLVRTEGFDSLLLQLPQRQKTRLRRGRRGSAPKRFLSLADFGAIGDGLHNDTQAFKDAWEIACSFAGRTRISIPAGFKFLVHPVDISGPCKSKVTLQIAGSIVAPKDPASWKGLNPRKWLYFHGINHLTLEGGGVINGMGRTWWSRSCKINSTNPCRHAPTALTFHKCKDLKLKNLKVVDSQQMHVAFTNCIRVSAFRLTVISPAFSPNTDGIHISASRGVEVKDSIVRTGDDCISIVSNSSRVTIRNITCGPGHGISIGSLGKSKSCAGVHDVMVDRAFLFNTDNGLRIKTWQGGSGSARDIEFQNVLMENVSNPIIIDQYYCDSPRPCANQTSAIKVENISFKHIKGTSATEEAIRFACSDDSPCEGLYLEDIQLQSNDGETTRSFCWEALGSFRDPVTPTPCFSCSESFIKQNVPLDSPQSF